MSSTLSSHRDTSIVTYEQLKAIGTPDSTRSWRPVSHVELIDAMTSQLVARGFGIAKQEFAIGAEGRKLFGTMDLTTDLMPGIANALGFRHANDKSMSIRIVAGGKVFVCDNMALSGDVTIMRQKHTWGYNLKDLIRRGLDIWQGKQQGMVRDITRMQETALSDESARALLAKSLFEGVTTFATFKSAYELYFDKATATPESYPDCAPRSAWGLHNAYTRALKDSTPNARFNTTIELSKVFGLGTEVAFA